MVGVASPWRAVRKPAALAAWLAAGEDARESVGLYWHHGGDHQSAGRRRRRVHQRRRPTRKVGAGTANRAFNKELERGNPPHHENSNLSSQLRSQQLKNYQQNPSRFLIPKVMCPLSLNPCYNTYAPFKKLVRKPMVGGTATALQGCINYTKILILLWNTYGKG